jgi:hypothetical protein
MNSIITYKCLIVYLSHSLLLLLHTIAHAISASPYSSLVPFPIVEIFGRGLNGDDRKESRAQHYFNVMGLTNGIPDGEQTVIH